MTTATIIENIVLAGVVSSFVAGMAVLIPLRLDPSTIDPVATAAGRPGGLDEALSMTEPPAVALPV